MQYRAEHSIRLCKNWLRERIAYGYPDDTLCNLFEDKNLNEDEDPTDSE